jgi:hypothetical protein
MASYEVFLERLRTGRLPKFGALRWDGESGEVITSVTFELSQKESDETVCQRAYEFFAQLTPKEQRALDIDVATRAGRPVRAVLKPIQKGVISTGRLQQMEGTMRR